MRCRSAPDKTVDREGLTALLAYASRGDTIIVYTLDRLGRGLRHEQTRLSEIEYLQLIERLSHDGVSTVADEHWLASPQVVQLTRQVLDEGAARRMVEAQSGH